MNFSKKLLIILLFLCSFVGGSNSLKPIFVERISQFVQWPSLQDKFIIGVYKDEKLKNYMSDSYKDKTIQKRPIKVYNIHNIHDLKLKELNVLYFSKEISPEIEKLLIKIKNLPILTITDYPNDVYNGMQLGFYYENQRVKFIVNQSELEEKKLKASYKLLKLAKIAKAGE